MLRHADEGALTGISALLDRTPETAVRHSALLSAYGTERSFFNLWVQNDGTAVLSRLDNSFSLLAGRKADYEELAFFLEFNPYFQLLTGALDPLLQVASRMDGGFECIRCNLMRYEGQTAGSSPDIDRSPDLRTLFGLVRSDGTEEELVVWYVDISHRIRHGCARAYLLRQEDQPVSACLVSAESGKAGLISGVFTAPAFRGRGFAKKVVENACADLSASGKIPVLECRDELLPFYRPLGFVKIQDNAELTVSFSSNT